MYRNGEDTKDNDTITAWRDPPEHAEASMLMVSRWKVVSIVDAFALSIVFVSNTDAQLSLTLTLNKEPSWVLPAGIVWWIDQFKLIHWTLSIV